MLCEPHPRRRGQGWHGRLYELTPMLPERSRRSPAHVAPSVFQGIGEMGYHPLTLWINEPQRGYGLESDPFRKGRP